MAGLGGDGMVANPVSKWWIGRGSTSGRSGELVW